MARTQPSLTRPGADRTTAALKWAGGALAALLGLALLVFAILQVPLVQRAVLERTVGSAAGASGITAQVRGTGGLWPWRITVAELGLTDAEGEFAQLTDVEVSLRPFAYLGGRIVVDRLAVGGGSYTRQPVRAEQPAAPFQLPAMPGPLDLDYDISVAEIALGPLAIGGGTAPVQVSGGGHFSLNRGGLNSQLAFDAGPSGRAEFMAQVDTAARLVEIALDIADPGGEWLVPLTPLPAGTPLSAQMRADGPPEAIDVAMNAAWGAARAELAGQLGWDRDVAFDLSGALEGAIGESERGWAGERQTFNAVGRLAADGSYELEQAAVALRSANLNMTGRVGATVDLIAELVVTDNARLAARLGMEVLEAEEATLRLSGPSAAPDVVMIADIARVQTADWAADRIRLEAIGTLSPVDSQADGEVRLNINSVMGAGLPPALSARAIDLRSTLRADLAAERVRVSALTGAWGPIVLDGEGAFAPERPMQFDARLFTDDLARLDGRLAGSAWLDLGLGRPRRGGPIEFILRGETEGFGATADLAALNGASPRVEFNGEMSPSRLSIETGHLALAQARADLAGYLDRQESNAEFRGQFSGADLSLLPYGLTGIIGGDFSLSGDLAAPQLVATAASPAVGRGAAEARNLNLRLEESGGRGALTFAGELRDAPLALEFPYERTGSDVSGEARLEFAGLRIEGPVAYRAGAPAVTLHAEADDIEPLVSVLRGIGGAEGAVRVRGTLSGDMILEDREGRVTFALAAPAIEGLNTPAGASAIELASTFDLTGAPEVDARLTLDDARFGPSRFSLIDAKAQGPLNELQATLSLRGPVDDPFRLDAAATRAEAGAGSEITFSSISGRSLDFELDLTEGGQLTVGPGGTVLAPTVFAVRNLATGREGTLGAEARLWTGAPFVRITTEDVPAGSLGIFGIPVDWTGQLDGHVTLDEQGAMARLRVALAATGLTNDPGVAPVDARLTALADGETLVAEATLIDTATAVPLLSGRSQMPLAWRSGELAPSINWNAPLEGALRADAPLERLWLFVPVDTMTVGGSMTADVALAGTLGTPVAQGDVQLAGGTLEHFRTGLLLRDARGAFTFTQDGDVAVDLRATDGNGGRARLEGTAHLPREEDWAIDGALRLNGLMLARRDDLRAVASGDLRLTGTLARALLEGEVTLDRVDAQIPNQLPPSVVDLDVVRVNGDGVAAPPGVSTERRGLSLPLDLDVNVSMPRRGFVRGRGLDSEWGGALHVGGTMQTPRLDGTISIVRGSFDLSRSRFELTEGTIDFLGGDRIDPRLRVEGRAPGPDFTAIIRATGRARQPQITITSDPVVPRETVMAQVLFGKRPEELSAFELVQIAEATASLTGSGGVDLLGTARRATGLDVLSVGARETESGGQSVDVTVGQYVSPNVFVGARRGLEPGSGAVTVEMEVTPDITVDAEVRQDTEGSVGVDWRRDY